MKLVDRRGPNGEVKPPVGMSPLPGIKDFEVEARKWCHIQGIDPDAREQFPDPNGYAVARYRAAWVSRAISLQEHWMKTGLVTMFMQRIKSALLS